ncbi:hypothetical protein B0H63DRAFT_507455 [Podospora didyma]|uniref:DM13 domain-containing protein n=1 Tax=Podospora didyma TaxID=330526 RepID=A0AAE0NYG7_9PEZI|nr:hypothetical protein B0H63DRAFT_507455 [Podospora didyma]
MQSKLFTVLAISATLHLTAAADSKAGWTGQLSSLDGGLGGIVTVVDNTTLMVNKYTLEDASAPALYWWGSASANLKGGFRISNKHVTEAATSDTLTIALDAGKTVADFATVGLWCEKFSANFGQATLAAPVPGQTGGGSTQPAKQNAGAANVVG